MRELEKAYTEMYSDNNFNETTDSNRKESDDFYEVKPKKISRRRNPRNTMQENTMPMPGLAQNQGN
jgi:hypothetical protein